MAAVLRASTADVAGIGVGPCKTIALQIEKLRRGAAEATLIRDLATDGAKREPYDKLHKPFTGLADEVERAANLKAAE